MQRINDDGTTVAASAGEANAALPVYDEKGDLREPGQFGGLAGGDEELALLAEAQTGTEPVDEDEDDPEAAEPEDEEDGEPVEEGAPAAGDTPPADTPTEPDYEAQAKAAQRWLLDTREAPPPVAYPQGIPPREQDPEPNEEDDPMGLLAWMRRERIRDQYDRQAERAHQTSVDAELDAIREEGSDWMRRVAYFNQRIATDPDYGHLVRNVTAATSGRQKVALLRKYTNDLGFQPRGSQSDQKPAPGSKQAKAPARSDAPPPSVRTNAPRESSPPKRLTGAQGARSPVGETKYRSIDDVPQSVWDGWSDAKRRAWMGG